MNPEARAAWASYLAERIAKRLDGSDWLAVVDGIIAIVGAVDVDDELERLAEMSL